MEMDMSRRRLVIAGVVAATVVVVAVVATAAALMLRAGHAEPGTDADHAHPDPSAVAEEAAALAIGQIFSWRPAEQAGPWDALHAASDTLTGTLAQAAEQRPADEPLPRQWAAWARSGDVVVGAVEIAGTRTDPEASETTVRLLVRQVVRHSDGTTTPLPEMTVLVDMVRLGHDWKAAEYRITDVK